MIRRALIALVPTLAALTFLLGTPAHSAPGPAATSAQWNAGWAKAATAKRALHEEAEVGSQTGWAADDEPKRFVRTSSTFRWPRLAAQRGPLWPADAALRRHPACASPPRGPPSS
jgi:hypothetical protein